MIWCSSRALCVPVRTACSSQYDQKTDLMEETRQLYFNTLPLTSRPMRGFSRRTSRLTGLVRGSLDLFREAANIYFNIALTRI
jgi:hypothetical protein